MILNTLDLILDAEYTPPLESAPNGNVLDKVFPLNLLIWPYEAGNITPLFNMNIKTIGCMIPQSCRLWPKVRTHANYCCPILPSECNFKGIIWAPYWQWLIPPQPLSLHSYLQFSPHICCAVYIETRISDRRWDFLLLLLPHPQCGHGVHDARLCSELRLHARHVQVQPPEVRPPGEQFTWKNVLKTFSWDSIPRHLQTTQFPRFPTFT